MNLAPIEKSETVKAVSKAQAIRLIDIVFLGPYMIYLASLDRKMCKFSKGVLFFFGTTTILYNLQNYTENKRRGF